MRDLIDEKMLQRVARDLARMWPLLILFAACFAVVLFLNPMKAGLTLYGIGRVALGGVLGYWTDRCVFPATDRPELLVGISRGAAWKRRAVIVAAAIVTLAFVP